MPQSSITQAWVYLRLSRDESEQPGLLEEKFERMTATARELAERHGLDLPSDRILVEQESGKELRNRPQLLRLLDLCHAGLCTHIISPFQDRIDRLESKRDQADLEDALYAGCVTVITRDGVTRYDDDFDPLPAEVRALIARHELRLYSKRRREANRQRLRRNERTSGVPPFGYAKAPKGLTVNAWRTEQGLPPLEAGDRPIVYIPLPAEYAILEDILARALAGEALRSIVRRLNEQGVSTPGHGRKANPAAAWDYSTVYDIVHNPIYAGYHCKRTTNVRGKGLRRLKPEDYILAEGEEGAWPHPLTLAQHDALRLRWEPWRRAGRAPTSLLAGILHCAGGSPMHGAGAGGRSYGCTCEGSRHYTVRPRWDEYARHMWCAFVEALPEDLLARPVRPPEDRQALQGRIAQASRQLRRAEEDVRALVTDQDRQIRLLGNELFETILSRTRQEWEKARGMLDQLQAQAAEPDMSAAITVLQEMRARGAAAAWEVAETHERRELLRLVVRSIRLAPTEGRFCHVKEAEIDWQPWVLRAGYAIPASKEWLPIRARTPRPNACT